MKLIGTSIGRGGSGGAATAVPKSIFHLWFCFLHLLLHPWRLELLTLTLSALSSCLLIGLSDLMWQDQPREHPSRPCSGLGVSPWLIPPHLVVKSLTSLRPPNIVTLKSWEGLAGFLSSATVGALSHVWPGLVSLTSNNSNPLGSQRGIQRNGVSCSVKRRGRELSTLYKGYHRIYIGEGREGKCPFALHWVSDTTIWPKGTKSAVELWHHRVSLRGK